MLEMYYRLTIYGPWEGQAPPGRLGCLSFPRGQLGVHVLPKGSAIVNISTNFMNVSTLILNASAKAGFVVQTLGGLMTDISHSLLLHGDLVIALLRSKNFSLRLTNYKSWPWGRLSFPRGQLGVPVLP